MSSLDPVSGTADGYRRLVVRRVAILVALAGVCIVAFVADLLTGPSTLAARDVITGLFNPDALSAPARVIILGVRLPQALMALAVGAALALAGAEMQTILNNPLASPFTLGVSSAASFGAALAIILGFGTPLVSQEWLVPVNAFLFAFGSVLLLQSLARLRNTGPETLVLFGIAMVFTFNALVALVQFIASQEALQQLVFWSMGSLGRTSWGKLAILAAVLAIVLPLSLADAWKMTALRLGEDRARSFGVALERLRFMALLRVSLLAATSVAFVGTIGFIGLVGPHIARLLVGEDHRFYLPASALAGAAVMAASSVAAKTMVPGAVMPIGIVTALIGVPFFVALIFASRGRA